MSIQAVAWVLEHSESKLGDRCVLFSLANHADKHGRGARPSIQTIASEANMHERNVPRCLQNLVEMGEIEHVGDWQNDRGRATKVWDLAKMAKPDNLAGDLEGQARFTPVRTDNQTNCPVTPEEANSGQIGGFITGHSQLQNQTNPSPKHDKSGSALKEGAVHKTVQDPTELAILVFETMQRLPACRNATGATPLGIDELIGEHPDMSREDWIDFARATRDKYSTLRQWGGENTTWSETPASVLRRDLYRWKKKRFPSDDKPIAPTKIKTIDDQKDQVFCAIDVADCMAWSNVQEEFKPAHRTAAEKLGLRTRAIDDDDRQRFAPREAAS